MTRPIALILIAALCCAATTAPTTAPSTAATAAKPRLAPVPPMGWNSWEAFRRDFDEDIIKSQADAMVSTGLRDAGYTYLVIDGGWKPGSRDDAGNIIPDPKKFPHGMKPVADYVHSKGLKFGLHQPAGVHDCPKLSPGSQNNEERDAALFADWGIDFIKYDQCDYIHAKDTTPGAPDFDRFVLRRGQDTVFSTEAEAVQNHFTGLARVELRETCSGGRCVSAIGYDNGAITIPDITVPAAGRYTLDVHFSYPYFGQNRDHFKQMTFFVSVKDGPRKRIDLDYTIPQRYATGVVSIDLDFKDGASTITVDNPNSEEEDVRLSYVKMAAALNRTGRQFMFSTSGAPRPWLWAQPIAHLYRCEGDITDRWSGGGGTIMTTLDRHIPLLDRAAVGFWPDPDMLEVGAKATAARPNARGGGAAPKMTDAEYRAHFSLWCIMNAPLFISMDLRQFDDATKNILLNRDVIAINQDPLASPCRCIRSAGDLQIFAKRLSGGAGASPMAVALFNRGASPADVEVRAVDLGIQTPTLQIRDLWTGESRAISDGKITATIDSHSVVMLRLSEVSAISPASK